MSKTPLNQPARLEALATSGLMDSLPEDSFDRLTRISAQILSAPISLLSLVDDQRQFFKSAHGLPPAIADIRQTPLTHSFCQHVVTSGESFVVEDSLNNPLVKDNLAVSELGVRAYIGVPVFAPTGEALGSLCAIDTRPRIWDDNDVEILRDLAQVVMTEIRLREELKKSAENEARLDLLSREMIHRVKNVFSLTSGIITISARDEESKAFAAKVSQRLQSLAHAQEYVHTPGVVHEKNLSGLISTLLSAYPSDRVAIGASAAMGIGENAATAFGFVIHELATNAVKYGALSGNDGRVDIAFLDRDDHVVVQWRERGGPKVDAQPTAKGFGSGMIDRSVRSYIEGVVNYDWHPEGLVVEISAPRKQISA